MKIEDNCSVVYLEEDDLILQSKTMKSFNEIEFYDFRWSCKQVMLKAYVVIYKDNSCNYKILKSRY